jgi:hypothetical protein
MKKVSKLILATLLLGSLLALSGCGHWGCWSNHDHQDHQGHGHGCCCAPQSSN